MDLAMLGVGVAAFLVIVVADRIDAIVDALWSSDDPLTDFDPSDDAPENDGTPPFDDS